MKKLNFVIVFFFFFLPLLATAVGYGGIGGRPAFPDPSNPKTASWFIYNLGPGEQKQDAVEVVNSTEEDLELLIYPHDSIKSSDGGFALKQLADRRDGVGSWVKLYEDFPSDLATTSQDIILICDIEKSKPKFRQRDEVMEWCQGKELLDIQLPANSSKIIPFIISIPKNAEVGEHTGGILIQKKSVESFGSSSGILISTRVGVRIYATVPGEIQRVLKLTKFTVSQDEERGKIIISLGLENSGNVSVDAEINLKFSDKIFRGNNQDLSRNVQILRNDELITNYEINRPKIGIVSIKPDVVFSDAEGQLHKLTAPAITLWFVPWLEIGLGAGGLILILVSLFVFASIKKRKYSVDKWIDYKVRKGDTITHLASQFNISWKFLSRINKIKAPYVLTEGQIIKLPASPKVSSTSDKRKPERKSSVGRKRKKRRQKRIRK